MKKTIGNRKNWKDMIGVLIVASLSLLIARQMIDSTSSLWTKADSVQENSFTGKETGTNTLLAEPVPLEIAALLKERETVIDYVQETTAVYAIISHSGRSDYGELLVIFQKNKSGIWERSYENDFKELKPWKIEVADIDGDGISEILTAVYKTTHFDEEERNRMFIFNYIDGILTKKWTGSDIAGNWNDFIVGDLLPMKGDELIFTQETDGKLEKISIYYWFDFGFLLLADSESYSDIQSVNILKENRLELKVSTGEKTRVILTLKDNKIVEVTD